MREDEWQMQPQCCLGAIVPIETIRVVLVLLLAGSQQNVEHEARSCRLVKSSTRLENS